MADEIDRAQAAERVLIDDALARHALRAAVPGPVRTTCLDCGDAIDLRRLRALPRAQRCTDCQDWRERYGG